MFSVFEVTFTYFKIHQSTDLMIRFQVTVSENLFSQRGPLYFVVTCKVVLSFTCLCVKY